MELAPLGVVKKYAFTLKLLALQLND